MINYTTVIQQYAEKHNHNIEFASAYGEPGYIADKGVILSSWHDVPQRIQDGLEAQGYELEWYDEWLTHDDKAYRTQPSSYHWEPSYLIVEGEIVTIHDNPEDWYQHCSIDDRLQQLTAIPSHLPRLSDWVYIDEPEYELGFTINDGADLTRAVEQLLDDKAERVAVVRSESSQFYNRYTVAYLPR